MRLGSAALMGSHTATTVLSTWVGIPTTDGVTVTSQLNGNAPNVRLVASESADMSAPVYSTALPTSAGVVKHTITGLDPDTLYYLGQEWNGVIHTEKQGSFRTVPAGDEFAFRLIFGNCNSGGSNAIFTAALAKDPLLTQHLGDLYYPPLGDIEVNDPALYHYALNERLGTPTLSPLMRSRPFLWTWGDHDYGSDGSDSASPSRQAALAAFRARVPIPDSAYFFTGPDDPVGYAYDIGPVKFIVPDARSARIGDSVMWGSAQKQAILDALSDVDDSGGYFVLCFESVPTGTEFSAADLTDVADHIKALGLEGRGLILFGDAHSTQIDDGTNHDFATGGGAKMIAISAGPFSQGLSFKGGPYSHGQFGLDTNQAGMMDMDIGATSVDCLFTGFLEDGSAFVEFPFQLSQSGYVAPPIYTIEADAADVDEGGTVTFSITSNQPNTSVTVNLSGIQAGDIDGGDLAPTVALDGSGNGTLAVTLTEDATTEGAATLTARIGLTAFTASVTVNDTSVTPPPEGWADIQKGFNSHNGPRTSLTVSLPFAATAGNLLVLGVFPDKTSGAIATPTDFTPVPGASHTTGAGISGALFYKVAAGGEQSVPCTWATGAGVSIAIVEIAGAHLTTPVDQVAFGNSASSNARGVAIGPTGACDTDGELAIALWANDSASTTSGSPAPAWTNGFAEIFNHGVGNAPANSSAPAVVVAMKELGAAGTVQTTFSYPGGSSDENLGFLVTLRPAA